MLSRARACSCRLVDDDALSALHAPSLLSLDVTSCTSSTARGVAAAVSRSPLLTHLFMRGLALSDDAVSRIAGSLPALVSVELGSSNPFGGGVGGTFTGAALLALAQACPLLQHVTAAGSGLLLLDADAAAAVRLMPHLHSLDVSGNGRVGDATLLAVSMHCPLLSTAKLFRCVDVTDVGLSRLRSCSTLTHVDVGSCSKLTAAGMEEFLRRPPTMLTHVVCGGIPALRPAAVAAALRTVAGPTIAVVLQ